MARSQTVSIREAKAHLSRYLHSVRQGNEMRLRSLEEKGLILLQKDRSDE